MWNYVVFFLCRKFEKIQINISHFTVFFFFFNFNNCDSVRGFRLMDVCVLK